MALTLKQIVINADETLGHGLELVEVRPAYGYVDGKRTDKLEGYQYICLVPKAGYDKVSVKILNTKCAFPEEGEQEKLVKVNFVGLKMSAYQDFRTQAVKFTVTADNILEAKA